MHSPFTEFKYSQTSINLPAASKLLLEAVGRHDDPLSKCVSKTIAKTTSPTILVRPLGLLKAQPNLDWSWSSNAVDPVDLARLNDNVDRMAQEFWAMADAACAKAGARWIWLEERANSLTDFASIYTSVPGGFMLENRCYAWSEQFTTAPGPHWLDAHSTKRAWFAAVRGLREPFDWLVLEDLEVCIVVATAMDDEGYVVQFLVE